MLSLILYYGMALAILCIASIIAVPILLALVAAVRGGRNRSFRSAMCLGRVWHTRLLPKVHKFTYPIFIFALDLEEAEAWREAQWPLSATIVQFRESDHLINGEGMLKESASGGKSRVDENEPNKSRSNNHENDDANSLVKRVLRLVAEKTEGKFQPTLKTHRVVILTHFCYFGYNFNPVSFYYIVTRDEVEEDGKIDAIVAEVSNTPWEEMYCYVLHPESVDRVELPDLNKSKIISSHKHYVFPKNFHVSPFMEMDYLYDWTFEGVPQVGVAEKPEMILVDNSMRRGGKIHFVAKLKITPQDVMGRPLRLAWQLIRYPFYCVIIQIWIHYEAFWLFLKGITYIPHPEGSETAASRAIASIMMPLFELKDRWSERRQRAPKPKAE